ncbi:hypothetical protein [Erythrobacter sp. HKB08]|uniref:hypothetical protein n=1 Tax=Erythrobacter sp. HKB08 TaxID=2502843 RepID=UPI00100933E0|nr:hypothetical protein [Erythrobacter sp. HKB08]
MGELMVIFGFVIVAVMIVTIGVSTIVNRSLEHKERMAATKGAGQQGISKENYVKLEERIRVLERIATENRSDLAAQIEQLRDLDTLEDFSSDRRETAA